MDAERWRQVERLYHAALECEPEERGQFIVEVCEGDIQLRREIESLLAQDTEGKSPLDGPAWEGADHLLEQASIERLKPGELLGPYQIESRIGAGGMGIVYRARDTRLKREVALKILRPEVAYDPMRRERFEIEARAVAALNHPNIVAVYDIGTEHGIAYIVSELVEGEPLDEHECGLHKVLNLGLQIADALAAAHAAGVIHRDLKPDNIFLTKDGRIKILDFGLAKLDGTLAAEDEGETASFRTAPGAIMGSAGYMSPEQVRGSPADHRSDIFSFGIILHELLSGNRLFQADTPAETMTAILNEDVPELPDTVPEALRHVVKHCLEKDTASRFQSAKDLSFALSISLEYAGPLPVTPPHRFGPWLWRGLPILLVLILLAVSIGLGSRWRPNPPNWVGGQIRDPQTALSPRISPDRHTIAFRALAGDLLQVAVMKPESRDWAVLTHTASLGPVIELGWSPDGNRVYFDRYNDTPQGIFSVAVLGGDEKLVLENAMWPEPLPDGSLLVVRQVAGFKYQLFRFWPENGRLQAFPLEFYGIKPSVRVFPDGREAIATATLIGGTNDVHLYLIDLGTGQVRRLPGVLEDESTLGPLAVTPDGNFILEVLRVADVRQIVSLSRNGKTPPRFLFPVMSDVFALDVGANGSVYLDQDDEPLELVRFKATGGQVRRIAAAQDNSIWSAALTDGRVVFVQTTAGRSRLVVLESGKSPLPLLNTNEDTYGPITSVGGSQIGFIMGEGESRAITVAAIATGRITNRIRFDKGDVVSLAATPDGKTLYCAADGMIWSVSASGGDLHRMRAGDAVAVDPRGRYLVIQAAEKTKSRLVRVHLDGSSEEEISLSGSFHLSPFPIASTSIDGNGRLLSPLASADSWYFPPGLIDLTTGKMTRIQIDRSSDFRQMTWAPDGQIMAVVADIRATIWQFIKEGTPR